MIHRRRCSILATINLGCLNAHIPDMGTFDTGIDQRTISATSYQPTIADAESRYLQGGLPGPVLAVRVMEVPCIPPCIIYLPISELIARILHQRTTCHCRKHRFAINDRVRLAITFLSGLYDSPPCRQSNDSMFFQGMDHSPFGIVADHTNNQS
jgi:hypothetical protein